MIARPPYLFAQVTMHTKLLRQFDDPDLRWSHVGPHHERCSFNLIDLLGYASVGHDDKPPYRLYNVYGWSGLAIPENSHATIEAAKNAGRAWILDWLAGAGSAPITWQAMDTGVHFAANADGVRLAEYYYCPTARPGWHVGFRVWFGKTYFATDLRGPDQAKEAIAATWAMWLKAAKERLLTAPAPASP